MRKQWTMNGPKEPGSPFEAGRDAAQNGKPFTVCPYTKHSKQWVRWMNGYQCVPGAAAVTVKKEWGHDAGQP